MKRYIYAALCILMVACEQKQASEGKTIPLYSFIDSFQQQHKDMFNNDMILKAANEEFITKSDAFVRGGGLMELPLVAKSVKQNEDGYLVHFENADTYFDNYSIHIDVFALTDSLSAVSIKQGNRHRYMIPGYTDAVQLYNTVSLITDDMVYTYTPSVKVIIGQEFNFGNFIVRPDSIINIEVQ